MVVRSLVRCLVVVLDGGRRRRRRRRRPLAFVSNNDGSTNARTSQHKTKRQVICVSLVSFSRMTLGLAVVRLIGHHS